MSHKDTIFLRRKQAVDFSVKNIHQIKSSTMQLNDLTQQNAAAAEELATTAWEMTERAEQLKDVILFLKRANYACKYFIINTLTYFYNLSLTIKSFVMRL